MDKSVDQIVTALRIVADESSAVAALIDVHDDYRIVWANRQLKEHLKTIGVAPEGMRWGGRCPFAFGIDAITLLNEVVRTGQPVHAEERPFGARVSSRFGEVTYWNWKMLPSPSEDCPGCVLVMAENVTDRVARKAAESSRETHFSGAVLDLPVGVATLDKTDFRILDANDIWLSYLPIDCQTRDSIGKTLPECMPNFEQSGLATILRRVASTRELFTAREFELKDPERGSIWWNLTVRHVETDHGRASLLMTVWEVTEHVNARRRADSNRLRAQALIRVQQAISASLSLNDVLRLITESARDLMDADASSVFLLSDDSASFVPVGATGIDVTEKCAVTFTSDESLAARALRDRRPVTASGVKTSETQCLPTLADGKPIVTLAAAPIEAEGVQIGVIEAYSAKPRRFTNDEMETLSTLASSAATAIVNARLYEEANRAKDELEARTRIIDNERKLLYAILESLPEAVAVVDSNYRIVRANEAARVLYRAEEGETPSLHELIARTHPRFLDGNEMGPLDHPLARAVRGEEFREFEYMIENSGEHPRYRSASGASVRDRDGSVIYGVTIGRDVTEQKTMQRRLEEAYERERRIAQTFQQALMTEVPHSQDGLEMAAIYEAGLGEAELGGDFFDIFSPEEGKLAIVIGDVAGKGLAAAIQIAAVKYGIRSYAYENPCPSHVVSRINDILYRDPPPGGFVSLFYGLIDVTTREMVFVNAGHEIPLLRRVDGSLERLTSDGIVLGVAPCTDYDERTTAFHNGDRLLMYTDGVTEARKESGEMLGEERLSDFWAREMTDGATASLNRVYHWAKEFSEGHFHDDVAILVIQARPIES